MEDPKYLGDRPLCGFQVSQRRTMKKTPRHFGE